MYFKSLSVQQAAEHVFVYICVCICVCICISFEECSYIQFVQKLLYFAIFASLSQHLELGLSYLTEREDCYFRHCCSTS